ncbi:hypothetical protein Tco_1145664 [Tanacetum coccineum]
MEVEHDIENMTLNKYLENKAAKERRFQTSVSLVRNRVLVYPNPEEEDKEYCWLPPLLQIFKLLKFNSMPYNVDNEVDIDNTTLDKIGGENLRSMEHEEVPNRCDDETVGDTDHKSGNLLNFTTFPINNEFANVCIQDEENIDINIVREKEEVPMEDVELDEDHDVYQPNDQLNFLQQINLSSISNKHFKSGLVECHTNDDVELPMIMDVARRSRLGAWLRACYLFIKLSKSKGVFRSISNPFNF